MKIIALPPNSASQKMIEEATCRINLPEVGDERQRFETKVKEELKKLVSIVTLSWDQLHYTQACVNSIKRHTKEPYELIIVDNGSEPQVVEYIKSVTNKYILNKENRGFAKGMNQGLAMAEGEYVVFLNNDTEVPADWLSKLIEAFNCIQDIGIVTPAITSGAGTFIQVRNSPNNIIRRIFPFSYPPSGICYLCKTEFIRKIGGWSEEYEIAAGEDGDLCFTVWTQGYEIILDERVLIKHADKGTAAVKIPQWKALWAKNNKRFLERWANKDTPLSLGILPRTDGLSREELIAKLKEERGRFARVIAQARLALTLHKEMLDKGIEDMSLVKFLYRKYIKKALEGTKIESVLRYIWKKVAGPDT